MKGAGQKWWLSDKPLLIPLRLFWAVTRSIFSAFVFPSATSSLSFRSSRFGPRAAKQWKPHMNFKEKHQFSAGQMVLQHLSTLLHSSCCHWALSPLQNKYEAKDLLDRRTTKLHSIAEAGNLLSCLFSMGNNHHKKSHFNGTTFFFIEKLLKGFAEMRKSMIQGKLLALCQHF